MMTQNEWIIRGETGVSSKTMWAAINGAIPSTITPRKGYPYDVPHDVSDFRRCLKYAEETGLSRDDLDAVKKTFPWFAPFIDHWDEVAQMIETEYGSGRCPRSYELIRRLEEQSLILDGWEQTGPGSWRRTS